MSYDSPAEWQQKKTQVRTISVKRARLRTGYAYNMLLPAAGIYIARQLDSCRQESANCSYDRLIAASILKGYIMNFCVALAILLACVASMRSTTVSVVLLLTVASVVFLSSLATPGWFVLFEYRELARNISNLLQFALNPGPQFSPFGFTPRNAVYLISLATVAWRSQGHYSAAYATILLFSFIHQAVAGFLFTIMLSLDLLLRPHIFRNTTVWPIVLAVLAVFLIRENLWEVMALSAKALTIVSAGVMAVLSLAYIGRSLIASAVKKIRELVSHLGETESDAVLLLIGFALSYPLIYLLTYHVDYFTMFHFWGQLNARVLAQIQPWLLFALWFALLRRLDIRSDSPDALSRSHIAGIAIALLLVVPSVVSKWKLDFSFTSYYDQMESLEKNLARPFATTAEVEEREDRFFYAMARTIDTGAPGLASLFSHLKQPAYKSSGGS